MEFRVLEDTEQNYRATAVTSRKYPKRLTDYITALVRRGRFLEAKHFFLDLCKISPNHEKTIRLGYSIAIATFDNNWVHKYDKLLIDSTADINEILWFQLRYYHAQNNISACEIVSCELLGNRLNQEQLSTILEVCIERQSYVIAEPLSQYLANNRLALHPNMNNWLKQIVITKLLHTLQRYK